MIEDQIATIEDGLVGEDSIPARLRSERVFDREKFRLVVSAMQEAARYYRNEALVPKRLALCFVDVSTHFFVSEEYFSEDEVEEIEDAGMKLSRLANALLS